MTREERIQMYEENKKIIDEISSKIERKVYTIPVRGGIAHRKAKDAIDEIKEQHGDPEMD